MIDKKTIAKSESLEKLYPGPPTPPSAPSKKKIKLEKYCNFHTKLKKDTRK